MRLLYATAVVTALLALGIIYDAKGRLDTARMMRMRSSQLSVELSGLQAEQRSLEFIPESLPVKFKADALSEFVSRAIEAGEVLGSGVNIKGAPFNFTETKHGLLSASVTISTAAETDAAPALLSLLEDEIGNLPAVVRKATAHVSDKFVSVDLAVDIYGR